LIGAIILAVWNRATPAYGLLFFGTALAPVSGLVPVQVPVLEHRLYLPMVGVALAVSAIAARLHGVRVAAALGAALFGGLAAMTAARLPIFHDDFVLWTTAVQAAPDSAYAWHGYAMSLAHLKRDREAVQVLEKVLDLDPNYARARYELGVGFERIGEHDKAVATIEDLLRRSPADIGGWNALAFFAKKQGDFRKSQQLLEQGLEARPRSRTLRENLADVLALRGDVARAMEIAEELLREDPRNGAYRARLERLRNAAAAAPRAG
jgi:tetratricopeptide (TPR) repeat protein